MLGDQGPMSRTTCHRYEMLGTPEPVVLAQCLGVEVRCPDVSAIPSIHF